MKTLFGNRVGRGACLWSILMAAAVVPCLAQMTPAIKGFGEIIYHRAAIDGSVQWAEGDFQGSLIDLNATFGLERTHGLAGKAGLVLLDAHELILDFRRYATSHDTELTTTVRFGDIAIPSFFPVKPSLTFQSVGLFYGYRLVNTPAGYLAIRPGVEFVSYEVGVEVDLFLIQLESPTYTGDHTVPFLWLAGEVFVHPLASLAGEISGGWKDEQRAYWGQGLLKFAVLPNLSVMVGYSRVWFQDETVDKNFDVTLSGPVFGIQASW
jgi:hypothetical protein